MKKLILAVLILSSVGCNFKRMKDSETINAQDETRFLGNPRSISYAQIQKQILAPSCLSCHSGRKQPSLTNYAEVIAAIDKIQDAVLVKKSMPARSTLSPQLRSLLAAWISVGAPELASEPDTDATPAPSASPAPTLPPIARPVAFADFKARVLEPSCVSCHAAGNKDGLTSMEDYDSVKSVVDLLSPIMTGKMGDQTIPADQMMPPPGSPAVTADQLSILQMWLDDGAKN